MLRKLEHEAVVWPETVGIHTYENLRATVRLTPIPTHKQYEWVSTFLTVAPPPGHLEPCDFEESMESAA